MNSREIYDFIKPHLGNIEPSGFHSADQDKLRSVGTHHWLVEILIGDLVDAYMLGKNRSEKSMWEVSNKAKEALLDIRDWLDNFDK